MNLNQVTVPTLDLANSIVFYETLGLKLIVHSPPRYARFHCPDGGSTFSVHHVEELPSGEGIYVYFECVNLDSVADELLAKGLSFDEMPEDKPWLWREARLKDPDGNRVILYHAGENRVSPPWAVS